MLSALCGFKPKQFGGMCCHVFSALLICFAVTFANAATLEKELIASGLDQPIFLTYAPGDATRVFVLEQKGLIRVIDISGQEPKLLSTPFLDLTGVANPGNPFYSEQGLLGLAFHPNYQENGQFYVNYSSFEGVGDTKIAQYRVSSNPNEADPNSAELLMTISQPEVNHNGGWMAFGPDGYLYIATGDGGGAFDQHGEIGNAQNLDSLLGKLLRIDVDSSDEEHSTYGIPYDNPFGNEIWAYGLRNAWRPSFDRVTGDLYIADVGQSRWEEINFQPYYSQGGENYGWRCMEGNECTNKPGCSCDDPSLVAPFLTYSRDDGCSITGGYVYRGAAIPSLQGHYVYADYCTANVWTLQHNGTAASEPVSRSSELSPNENDRITYISSFGEDASGELYICDYGGGKIFKIVAAACAVKGDFNGDCIVDVDDLASLLVVWGPCDDCPQDIDKNGVVDISDLAILLTNWGRHD